MQIEPCGLLYVMETPKICSQLAIDIEKEIPIVPPVPTVPKASDATPNAPKSATGIIYSCFKHPLPPSTQRGWVSTASLLRFSLFVLFRIIMLEPCLLSHGSMILNGRKNDSGDIKE